MVSNLNAPGILSHNEFALVIDVTLGITLTSSFSNFPLSFPHQWCSSSALWDVRASWSFSVKTLQGWGWSITDGSQLAWALSRDSSNTLLQGRLALWLSVSLSLLVTAFTSLGCSLISCCSLLGVECMSHLPQSPRAELNTPVVPFCTCKAPLDTQLPPSLETVFCNQVPFSFLDCDKNAVSRDFTTFWQDIASLNWQLLLHT